MPQTAEEMLNNPWGKMEHLQSRYGNKRPVNIIHSDSLDRKTKYRQGWHTGVATVLENCLAENVFNSEAAKVAQDYLNYYDSLTNAKEKVQTYLTTPDEIEKADIAIKTIMELSKDDLDLSRELLLYHLSFMRLKYDKDEQLGRHDLYTRNLKKNQWLLGIMADLENILTEGYFRDDARPKIEEYLAWFQESGLPEETGDKLTPEIIEKVNTIIDESLALVKPPAKS